MQSYGGISRYFARLAKGLLEIDQEVEIFAPLHRNSYLPTLPREIINGNDIYGYPPGTTRLLLAYNHWRSKGKIEKWKPDIVHETYYSSFLSAPRSCPTIITVYDMIHELFPEERSTREHAPSVKRIAIDRADHVICISENTRLDLMRLYGTPASKLSVVHLGFDRFAFRDDGGRSTKPTGKPFVLYVGNRSGYKNFVGFLSGFASSIRLVADFDIVAFGGPGFSRRELETISALGFRENQVHQKSGSDDALGRLYSSAKALVYPSLYEGFGIPPLEAMAHQCPVISSDASSIPEVIGDAAQYFNPSSIDDMRQAVEAVVYSDTRIGLLKKLGSERLTLFSWEKCSRETLNVYESVVP